MAFLREMIEIERNELGDGRKNKRLEVAKLAGL